MIAVLLMTVLYGKSVASVTYKAFSTQQVPSDTEEAPAEDNGKSETEKSSSFKGCKKPWTEMETGEWVLPVHPDTIINNQLLLLHHCLAIQKHFQQVPTPPPLHVG